MAKESKIITNLKSVRESTGMTQQELAEPGTRHAARDNSALGK